MPADRRLVTVLQTLQVYSEQQDTPRLLSSASYLLTTLSNPFNITLLSTHLLSAPALWTHPSDLRACLRFLGCFQIAAQTLLKNEEDEADRKNQSGSSAVPNQPVIGSIVLKEEWVKSVIKGADERSPRWRHLLVIAGIIVGFERNERHGLSHSLRSTVGTAFVRALNLALVETPIEEELGRNCIALVTTYVFELLSDAERSQIDYDLLLPILVNSAFFSEEGYASGWVLAPIDSDVTQITGSRFTWSDRSPSFIRLTEMSSRPLMTNMGPLSRLIAHSLENCKNPWVVPEVMTHLSAFAETLMRQWRQLKLSEVDFSEENLYFDDVTLNRTLPILWKLLRSSLFATTIIIRSAIGRVLNEPCLAAHDVAPMLAKQVLGCLRHLSFIATRLGPNNFSQYTFVYLASIDILSAYTLESESFIMDIRPTSLGYIPPHPLDRTLDLFFLNTAEHFTLVLSPHTNGDLLIAAATPYLVAGGNNHLVEIFEAAHSLTLAVLSSPQNPVVAAAHLPSYVDTLFRVFPTNLSSRQFRLAFRTLLRITTPPSLISAAQPDLPETLLELLHHRAISIPRGSSLVSLGASEPPITPDTSTLAQHVHGHHIKPQADDEELDEQTTLVVTLIDCLPFLPPPLLTDWLPLAAELIPTLESRSNQQRCRDRFWEVLSGGEMDVDRSQLCVAWWTTRGGMEMVMGTKFGGQRALPNEDYMMTGAAGTSKL